MIYADSLRHFVQEWIVLTPPRRLSAWGWGKGELYLINFYPYSAPDKLTVMPAPIISVLIDKNETTEKWINAETQTVYKGYFGKQTEFFELPRKYLYSGEANSGAVFKMNRYTCASDAYKGFDYDSIDSQLLRYLNSRPHIRRNCSLGGDYDLIINRLAHYSRKFECPYRYADNILDCTDYAASQYQKRKEKQSPQTFLIAAPILGILSPIKRSRAYRIINAALHIGQEPVLMAVQDEPCQEEYQKESLSFHRMMDTGWAPSPAIVESKTLVYLVVEVPNGVFTFQEFFPKSTTPGTISYCRTILHSFGIYPVIHEMELTTTLKHSILESLIVNAPESRYFLRKKREGPLFGRDDLPKGVFVDTEGYICAPSSEP